MFAIISLISCRFVIRGRFFINFRIAIYFLVMCRLSQERNLQVTGEDKQ